MLEAERQPTLCYLLLPCCTFDGEQLTLRRTSRRTSLLPPCPSSDRTSCFRFCSSRSRDSRSMRWTPLCRPRSDAATRTLVFLQVIIDTCKCNFYFIFSPKQLTVFICVFAQSMNLSSNFVSWKNVHVYSQYFSGCHVFVRSILCDTVLIVFTENNWEELWRQLVIETHVYVAVTNARIEHLKGKDT